MAKTTDSRVDNIILKGFVIHQVTKKAGDKNTVLNKADNPTHSY